MEPLARFRDLCVDAADPAVVGRFWGAVLGRDVQLDGGDAYLPAGADGGPSIYVNRVPEPKTAKVRIHVDVTLEAGRSVDDLRALGATVVTEPGAVRWWVMADPEGNEFCAFPAEPPAEEQ